MGSGTWSKGLTVVGILAVGPAKELWAGKQDNKIHSGQG